MITHIAPKSTEGEYDYKTKKLNLETSFSLDIHHLYVTSYLSLTLSLSLFFFLSNVSGVSNQFYSVVSNSNFSLHFLLSFKRLWSFFPWEAETYWRTRENPVDFFENIIEWYVKLMTSIVRLASFKMKR